jgi:hypothetical protein
MSIRKAANLIKRGTSSMNGYQFNIEVITNLPLMPSDLRPEDIPRIYDLLGQVKDHFGSLQSARSASSLKQIAQKDPMVQSNHMVL